MEVISKAKILEDGDIELSPQIPANLPNLKEFLNEL
jgi:hypothetical protein